MWYPLQLFSDDPASQFYSVTNTSCQCETEDTLLTAIASLDLYVSKY